MSMESLYQVRVTQGRKAGAAHALPLGDLSIGTTLDSEFFIGCVDMWHQLLRADASADSRSASATDDVMAELWMRVVIKLNPHGLKLYVEQGFAEIGHRRLLQGESCAIAVGTPIRIGSTQIEVQALEKLYEDDVRSSLKWVKPSSDAAKAGLLSQPVDFGGRAGIAGLTALAVAMLIVGLVIKQHDSQVLPNESLAAVTDMNDSPVLPVPVKHPQTWVFESSDGEGLRHALINNQRIVAIVTSSPAFLMTDVGERYDIGSAVDDGYRISQIDAALVEFTRGLDVQRVRF